MVTLEAVRSSNKRIATALPSGLVAVFVGATSGIGEYSVKCFAKHATKPRIYIIGRSKEAGERVKKECQTLNPEGEFIFVSSDLSLLKNVDDVCRDIKAKESVVNLLMLSQGAVTPTETSEGLRLAAAVAYYGRIRVIANLLPLLEAATAIRRVITILAGTKTGPVFVDDPQGYKVPLVKLRGHLVSMMTLSLETLAEKAPTVSFIHGYPGLVRGNLIRDKTWLFAVARGLMAALGPFIYMRDEECGERHVFMATSARYPPKGGKEGMAMVALESGGEVARADDGKVGGGVYVIDEKNESGSAKVEAVLAKLREDGVREKVWEDLWSVFKRITGEETI